MAIYAIRKQTLAGLCFLVASLLLSWAPGRAETVKRVSAGTTYDTHAYGSYAEETDTITRVNLYLAHRSQGDRSQLETYYSGTGNIFAQSGTRSFTTHRLGVSYARQMGEGRSGLFASGDVSFRKDRSIYDVYDTIGLQSLVNGKWYIRPTVMLRLGYRLKWRSYWNLDPYSYTEHVFSAQASKFLPSLTSLRAEVSYGYKDHRNPGEETVGFGPFQGSRSRGFGGVVEPGVPDEGQFVLALQIAQSLAEQTGLSLRYQARLNTSSGQDNLYGEDLGTTDDEDVFNDRYDYEGQEWTARLTQQLPWRSHVVFEGGYETRRYDGRAALDLSGQPIASGAFRKDRNTFGSISVEKLLAPNLEVGIGYGYEQNRSSDLYTTYDGRHSLSVNFDIDF